jgi:hypothetical protein
MFMDPGRNDGNTGLQGQLLRGILLLISWNMAFCFMSFNSPK